MGKIADDFAKRFESYPIQSVSIQAVIELIKQVELAARSDESLVLTEALLAVGMLDAASLLHRHSKGLLVEMQDMNDVLRDELIRTRG